MVTDAPSAGCRRRTQVPTWLGRAANEPPVARTAPGSAAPHLVWFRRPRTWLLGGVVLGVYAVVLWLAWIFVLPAYVIGLWLLPFRALAILFGLILGLR